MVLDESNWITSVSFPEDRKKNNIFKSTDQGKTWIPFRNNFGVDHTSLIPDYLDVVKDNPSVLFGGSLSVGRSTDGGQSWESVAGLWGETSAGRFVKIDRSTPSNIWAGGSDYIFEPTLIMSDDGGDTWKQLDENLQIFGNTIFESSVFDLAIKPGHSSQVLIGLRIGIFRSSDLGATWEMVYEEATILSLANSPRSSGTVYASGINQQGSLFVLVTSDFGDTWRVIEMEDSPEDIRVNDLVALEEDGREVLYFGTNKGIYSYRVAEQDGI